MNQNQFQFQRIDFTHDQIEIMFKLLYEAVDFVDGDIHHRATLSFLTKEQYVKLIEEIGLDNISTFSGKYEDLENLPNIFQIIADSMDDLDIETKAHVNELIVNMSKEYNLIAEQIVKGLREEIARVDYELTEYIEDTRAELKENIEDDKNTNMPNIEKRIIKLNTDIPEDEDFGL